MTLRLRLLLGYGYLIALLLLAAGSAIFGFLHLSESVDVVLEENLFSINASMRMLESLERQDSATLASLLGGEDHGDELAELEAVFRGALDEAEANITEEPEPAILAAIRSDFATYLEHRDALLGERPAQPLHAYNERVFPAFQEVKRGVLELLEINQGAVIEADRSAKAAAVRSSAWLGFLVAVALLSLVFLSRALQRHLLTRLQELRRDTAALVGRREQRLSVTGSDELAQVAHHVNELLDQFQASEAAHRGRLAQERRALLGLVGTLGRGAAVYDPSGRLLAAAAAAGDEPPAEIHRWIGKEHAERPAGGDGPQSARVDTAAGPYRVEPLRTAEGRPVGWLARPAATP